MKDKRTEKQKVIDGFKLVGWILFAIAVFGFLVAGAISSLGKLENHSRAGGILFVCLALTALTLTINHAAKWIYALLSYTAFRSIGPLISGQLNNGRHIDRWLAAEFCVVLAASALLTSRYSNRSKLTLLDKVTTLVALTLFGFGAAMESAGVLALMLIPLGIPWLFDNKPRRRVADA